MLTLKINAYEKVFIVCLDCISICSCSENSMEPLPIEVDADCVDIVNDESFVPVSQATEVAGLFLAANGKDAVTTRNGFIEQMPFLVKQ